MYLCQVLNKFLYIIDYLNSISQVLVAKHYY